METNSAPYVFVKRGIYYFSRRVPTDLNDYYKAKRIIYSLRTQSSREARSRALSDALKLDTYWTNIRLKHQDIPGQHLIRDTSKGEGGETVSTSMGPRLSDATGMYLKLKGNSKPDAFGRAARRSCGYVIKCAGNKCLADYTRACLLYTSPSPRDLSTSRMPSSA